MMPYEVGKTFIIRFTDLFEDEKTKLFLENLYNQERALSHDRGTLLIEGHEILDYINSLPEDEKTDQKLVRKRASELGKQLGKTFI